MKAQGKDLRVTVKALRILSDQHPLIHISNAGNAHLQPEPVQELRPDLSLLWIHGAHQYKFGGMSHRYALAFNDIHSHGGGVEKDIGHMIIQ